MILCFRDFGKCFSVVDMQDVSEQQQGEVLKYVFSAQLVPKRGERQ